MFDIEVEGRTGTANKEIVIVYDEGQFQQAQELSDEIKSLSQGGNDFLEHQRPLHLVILRDITVGRYSKLPYLQHGWRH